MKKIIAAILLTAFSVCAQDFTYSTNLFYSLPYTTNIYIGTNGTDGAGDSFHVWATKLNHNATLLGTLYNSASNITATNIAWQQSVLTNGGFLYPSNVWNLTAVTSGLPNFSYWVGSSNGNALVSVSLSNGTARIKQLMP